MQRFLLVLFIPLLFSSTCVTEDDEEDGPITLVYEERMSGCNNYDFGPWEEFCVTINEPRDDWSLEDFEANYSGSDIHCASTCCLNYQMRNAYAFYGTCDDVGMDEY